MEPFLIGLGLPDKLIREASRMKALVARQYGAQLQLNEPPHCTLLLNRYANRSSLDQILNSVATARLPLQIQMNGIGAFNEGNAAKTIYLKILRNDRLESLQETIAVRTKSLRHGSIMREYYERNFPNQPLPGSAEANIRKYGYSYVGKTWTPHVTIATVDNSLAGEIIEELQGMYTKHSFPTRDIVLYSHAGVWTPIRHYYFKRQAHV